MDVYEVDAHMRELTPHQTKILEALYHVGADWASRAQIARAIGKRRLTPYDINILSMLARRGFVEVSTRPTTAPGSEFAYVYRMPDDVATALQHWADLRAQTRAERRMLRRPINLQEARYDY